MSEAQYQAVAQRRARRIWLLVGLLLVLACSLASAYNAFYDNCTGGFDRAPTSLIRAYGQAIGAGELEAAQRCWDHQAFFELGSGCSEICLTRILGTQYLLGDIRIAELPDASGRARLEAQVETRCEGAEQTYTATLLLDSVASRVPWRHWKIIESDFGGPLSAPWCQ